ncbi:MAG: pyridoxal phosphate-dependent aminotransferase [Planctomycetes bacterium]|nr:pyridoxal phosphate-dependent aminotransferase [Planctomycetota bacterium]
MEISRRGAQVPASPIRRLVPYAEAAKKGGATVYHTNIGQPDLPTPDGFWAALSVYPSRVLAYGHSAGSAEFREGLAGYYRRCGYDVAAEDVTVTTGGSEAILFAMLATCDPGDEVLVFEPFYTNYHSFALSAGVFLVPVTCRAEDGYHLPPPQEIEVRVGPRTRAILACSPNNPTGTVLSRAEMESLAGLCRRRRLFFLSDEVYREFVYGEKHTGVLELGLGHQAVMLDSISKRFSACGARIGCAVTKNPALQKAFLHLGQARLSPPTLEQAAALPLLELGPDYYGRIQKEYRARRDVVVDALERIPGVVCRRPAGAFYVMARLPVANAEDFAIWLLQSFRLRGATVMVAPGDGFYATPGRGKDEIRIAYVLEKSALARAMECLAEGLAAYGGVPSR